MNNDFLSHSTSRKSQSILRTDRLWLFALVSVALLSTGNAAPQKHAAQKTPLRFEISFSKDASAAPLDGRMMLLVSTDDKDEPRFQINYRANSQQMFGIDVDGLAPDSPASFDASAIGYPVESIGRIPAGDYYVQGLLNIYETFHRADGHVVKLPMDHGEGQQWNRKPGNLFSKPEKIHVDPAAGGVVRIRLTEKIAPIEPPKDTKYVKHLRIQSELLTKFWGRPMELGAHVLLPEGWEDHPNAHYPLMIMEGHFSQDLFGRFGFRTEPPTPDMKGTARAFADSAYRFYQDWVAGRLPRMLVVEIQHPNPYFDDSYAVNSANVGPYGDAIMQELLPAIEKKFRGISQGWARGLYGGSTGGWEALGVQIFYPNDFNGAWCFCPDTVDFRAYQDVNLYENKNVFWTEGPWAKVPIPSVRTPDDQILATMQTMNQYENVLGSHGRSTEQFGIWQAVFVPVGADGYPKPIWDPSTGVIDHSVTDFMRENYDLRYILERDWKTLGPKLVGKLHVTVGTRDTYFLDNAVRLLQKFLDNTNNPYYAGDFEYGPHEPHCWTGGTKLTTVEGYMTLHQRILPKAAAWMEKTAPAGADTTSWKY
ncbi:MAG: alpha/beta hydrolase-fold protein [Candidatus Acidiferrales bacterium]